MNILLLGATGQIGFELHRALSLLGDVTAPGRDKLNLMDEVAVTSFLHSLNIDLIVNAVGWTSVDGAEENPAAARRLNTELPQQLAQHAASYDLKLVHYSSEYVYSGKGTSQWQESSIADPLSVYGKTKLDGDKAIQESGCNYLIFRTSWVYSARGSNFMKTILDLAKKKARINVVADQVGSPTAARLVAQITAMAVHRQLQSGLYHLASRGHVSWHRFAMTILKLAQDAGEELILQPQNTHAISSAEYITLAKRPLNSRMAVTKLEKALNIELPSWERELELTLNEYLEK
ncbi:dTDP-4-dehydrorhamnose reductase [Idiomarina abyssalis]|uniref:dTDP-4-dehydrorhamnose reductase n=1 Tax=Idiomarina abyssalis TaxID=86102 RepID=UPI003A8FBCDE